MRRMRGNVLKVFEYLSARGAASPQAAVDCRTVADATKLKTQQVSVILHNLGERKLVSRNRVMEAPGLPGVYKYWITTSSTPRRVYRRRAHQQVGQTNGAQYEIFIKGPDFALRRAATGAVVSDVVSRLTH